MCELYPKFRRFEFFLKLFIFLSKLPCLFEKNVSQIPNHRTQISKSNQRQEVIDNLKKYDSFDDENILSVVLQALDKRTGEQWALKDILTTSNINEIARDIERYSRSGE